MITKTFVFFVYYEILLKSYMGLDQKVSSMREPLGIAEVNYFVSKH